MIKFECILLLFLAQSAIGQMIDNREGRAFGEKPFFNTEFIRLNKIKSLSGTYTYKKPGESMSSTKYKQVFHFDTLGRLLSSYETRKDDGTKDTIWQIFKYTEDNKLAEFKKGDGKGFNVTGFVYDKEGRVIKEIYFRDYVDTLQKVQRTILNTESMRYENADSLVKMMVYNSYDLPYMQKFFYYNALGYLKAKEERLIMAAGLTNFVYAYNEKGLISSIKQFRGEESIPSEEEVFLYDINGNLIEKQIYRSGKYVTEMEMIYNEKSKLLSYVLTRDVTTNFIMILGFKNYSFY